MINLLNEIIDELDDLSLKLDDVKIIYDGKLITDYSVLDFEYDNGFGTQKIYNLFLIIDENHWFERYEYDGQEWFTYCVNPSYKYQELLNRECKRICRESCEFCNLEIDSDGDTCYVCKLKNYYAPLHDECYYPKYNTIRKLIKENKIN